jgi:hypothetical protein
MILAMASGDGMGRWTFFVDQQMWQALHSVMPRSLAWRQTGDTSMLQLPQVFPVILQDRQV